MRKKIIIAIAIALVMLFVGYLVVIQILNSQEEEGYVVSKEGDILLLSEGYPTQILIYGEDLGFDERLSVELIDSITAENIKRDESFEHLLIIINDLDGKSDLTEEEWNIIANEVKSSTRSNFIYLGENQFEKILNTGIIEGELTAFQDGDLSVAAIYEGDTLISVYGTYTYYDRNMQGDICELILRSLAFGVTASM